MKTSTTAPTAPEIARAAGDLAKSVGRFSVAMSVFAARQTAAIVSSAASGDDPTPRANVVARAAGDQLTGMLKTAYAVGTNLQSGVVDAAFDMASFSSAGPAPTGPTTALSIAMKDRIERRVKGVKTVASGALGRPVPQSELVARLNLYQADATSAGVTRDKAVEGLWKSEGLATTVGKHFLRENSFADPALARQVLPIAHVGFGSGSTEAQVFDVPALDALLASACHPDYAPFAYEGIGAIIRIYERGLFKVMSGALGLISLAAPDGPDPKDFFAEYLGRYPAATQRLITHGYGRLVAFSNIDIYTAIRQAAALPVERVEPAVHGAAFAFAMMNAADMPRILENSAVPFAPPVRAAFQNGLMYSLVFFDWYSPGLLDAWQPVGPTETTLIEHARREAAASQARGRLLPFHLENPRT